MNNILSGILVILLVITSWIIFPDRAKEVMDDAVSGGNSLLASLWAAALVVGIWLTSSQQNDNEELD